MVPSNPSTAKKKPESSYNRLIRQDKDAPNNSCAISGAHRRSHDLQGLQARIVFFLYRNQYLDTDPHFPPGNMNDE
jgi:hypothetical protein